MYKPRSILILEMNLTIFKQQGYLHLISIRQEEMVTSLHNRSLQILPFSVYWNQRAGGVPHLKYPVLTITKVFIYYVFVEMIYLIIKNRAALLPSRPQSLYSFPVATAITGTACVVTSTTSVTIKIVGTTLDYFCHKRTAKWRNGNGHVNQKQQREMDDNSEVYIFCFCFLLWFLLRLLKKVIMQFTYKCTSLLSPMISM